MLTENGLRERKRLATRRAIQHAVLTLSLRNGIDKVTVEDISREAGISARTFFNYFASKDAALLGDATEVATEADIEAFVHGGPDGDIFAQLAVLLAAGLQRVEADREIHRLRQAVMKDSPYLFGLGMASLRDFEVRLLDIVTRRFTADHPGWVGTPALTERALLFTLVAVAVIRHAWRCWAEGDDTPLTERLTASFGELYNMTRSTG